MDSALSAIASILDDGRAQRPDAGLRVWRLEYGPLLKLLRDAEVARTKTLLLEAAWEWPGPLFFAPGNPLEEDVRPFVQPDGRAWRVDKRRTASDFYATDSASRLGNWQLYAAERPVEALPDAHRTSPADLIAFMDANGIVLLIDSFHDDTDWCVAICEQQSAEPFRP